MSEEQLDKLTINYLTEDQYNEAKESGEINENELYATPDASARALINIIDNLTSTSVTDALSANQGRVLNETKQDKIQDSGWITATLNSAFTNYASDNLVEYRRIGNIAEIAGVVKPTATISGSSEATIFTLPTEYRPTKSRYFICQGSYRNIWLLAVKSNGIVSLSRHGSGSDNFADVTTSVWLPFNATYFIG